MNFDEFKDQFTEDVKQALKDAGSYQGMSEVMAEMMGMSPEELAMMLMTDKTLNPYSDTSYHSKELKSLTRYRLKKC